MNKLRVLALVLLVSFAVLPGYAAESGKKQVNVLFGRVDQFASLCGTAGIQLSGQDAGARIEGVRLGSPAYYSGILRDDKIMELGVKEDRLCLLVERDQKRFRVEIPIKATALRTQTPRAARSLSSNAFALSAHSDAAPDGVRPNLLAARISKEEAEKIVSKYEVILLVDCSGSMNARLADCGKSRLDYVVDESRDFAKFLSKTITVIPFNSNYAVVEHHPSSDLHRLFQRLDAHGGTDIAAPVKAACAIAMRKSKPCIVVVMTDGGHNAGQSLPETMIQASRMVRSKGDLVVSFIQIGATGYGYKVLKSLDEDLVSNGAAYDIVDCKYYPEIRQFGLTRVLAEAILRARGQTEVVRAVPGKPKVSQKKP